MSKKVIVFKASWCAPCRNYAPVIEKLKPVIKEKGYELLIVDVDENHEMAQTYGVRGIPATIIEKNEDIYRSLSGIQKEEDLLEILQ